MDGHTLFLFFPFDVETFPFVPLTVYPWCKCSKKVQETRVFRNLLTTLIDDLLSIPLFIFPQQHPFFLFLRRYYLQQYQQHLTQYREMEEDFKLNKGATRADAHGRAVRINFLYGI